MAPTRRDFIKNTLAATAVAIATPDILLANPNKPDLLDKTKIKNLEIRNRMVRSSVWSGTADSKGYVTDRTIDFYHTLATGNIGMILSGYMYVMTNGMGLPHQTGIYADDQVVGLKRLTDAIHQEKGVVIGQLVHCLAKADQQLFLKEGDELWGASAVAPKPDAKMPKEMTKKDIVALVEAHGAAAKRCIQAGFDGIQLHGAHGYGMNQFLSPYWNRRTDLYGGSEEKRYRIVGEIIEATRGAIGKDYPLLFKLSANDFEQGGIQFPEAVSTAKRLAENGIDLIQVSGGCTRIEENCIKEGIEPGSKDEAYFLEYARKIKEAVGIPVMTVGGVRSLPVAQAIVRDKNVDYVSFGRPLIREPHLIKRWIDGDTSPAACISCNQCFDTGREGKGVSCFWLRSA